jgi:hypothetical protein
LYPKFHRITARTATSRGARGVFGVGPSGGVTGEPTPTDIDEDDDDEDPTSGLARTLQASDLNEIGLEDEMAPMVLPKDDGAEDEAVREGKDEPQKEEEDEKSSEFSVQLYSLRWPHLMSHNTQRFE